jgi:hypothetical protein
LLAVPAQWVHLGAGGLLIASSRGAWIQPLELDALALGGSMRRSLPGTPETTRHLLDGALAAAERAAPLPSAPHMTARRWAWELVNQGYVATHSIALLGEAHQRYARLGRRDLAEFTLRRLDGERGHDQFPLDDLSALGYDANKVVREVPPSGTAAALIAYAADCVQGAEPVEFLGYLYGMERDVIRLSAESFAALDEILPVGVDAASGLRAHATDLDVEHVDEAVSFIANLPADDRAKIAIGCYRTTLIRNSPPPAGEPSEADLEGWFAPLQTKVSNQGGPA